MRIAIVEDEHLLRGNLQYLLGGEKDIEIIGAYGSGEDALPGLKACQPDMLLTDLGLPGMSGIELIKKVKEELPDINIMAFTVFEDRDVIFSAIKAGASGYVLKGSPPRELVESVWNLHNGGAPMSPRIARVVIMEFQGVDASEDCILSRREKEVLKSIEKGLSYKEIADIFSISGHTVHTHIKNIYEKLQAKSRQDALRKAKQKGII